MKKSLWHLSNFTICPSFSTLIILDFTFSSKCKKNPSTFGLNCFRRRLEMCKISIQRYFSYSVKKSFEIILHIKSCIWMDIRPTRNGCFCAISITIRGKLSFPKMFLSCPAVIKIGVSSEIHPLDCILTTIFPLMFIVSLVKRQYGAQIFLSTGRISNYGSLSFSSSSFLCFRKLTGLAESTGIFILTIASSQNPIFISLFVSTPLSS